MTKGINVWDRYRVIRLVVFGLAVVALAQCNQRQSELVWGKELFVIGSQSSPRATDLNGDGTLDIVMGAGKNERQSSAQGIIALNGKTGELLWQQEAEDQVYGSATFYDVTGDGTNDVFIGGRSPHFKALDGVNGQVLWAYTYQYENDPILKYARFNFCNSVLVPDQNGNGYPELLTVNGGNSKAYPHAEKDRYPGVLMLMDSKSGEIVAADTMPDGKETYMSPLCFAQPGREGHTIIFGTGGETLSGHLYWASLSDFVEGKLSRATIIAEETGHGFIAPPVLADVNQDGYYDVMAISHASTVFAIEGKGQQPLWSQKIKNTESSNAFAVGYFTEDDIPDVFTFVSKGEWPNNTGSLQVMLDGKNGAIAYLDSMGCTGFSSPVVYDLDGDGRDEAIISINEFNCSKGFTDEALFTIENKLVGIDFKKGKAKTIDQLKGFKNIFSTPWLGDLDQDGYLDIVHCQYYSRAGLLTFLGMMVKRISTPIKMKEAPGWGAYMGTHGDGVFEIKKEE